MLDATDSFLQEVSGAGGLLLDESARIFGLEVLRDGERRSLVLGVRRQGSGVVQRRNQQVGVDADQPLRPQATRWVALLLVHEPFLSRTRPQL
jgi:hypothetical protein